VHRVGKVRWWKFGLHRATHKGKAVAECGHPPPTTLLSMTKLAELFLFIPLYVTGSLCSRRLARLLVLPMLVSRRTCGKSQVVLRVLVVCRWRVHTPLASCLFLNLGDFKFASRKGRGGVLSSDNTAVPGRLCVHVQAGLASLDFPTIFSKAPSTGEFVNTAFYRHSHRRQFT
jgi:hypothetical protein